MQLFLTGQFLLTPLGVGRETFGGILAGEMVVDRGVVDEGLLQVDGVRMPTGAPAPLWGGVDKSIRMALAAAAGAVREAGWTEEMVRDEGTGIFAGTSKGPILSWLRAADEVAATGKISEGLARQVTGGAGVMGDYLARAMGARGVVHTSVAACSSGMHALHRAARAVRCGECERAMVVAADASIHELFEGSFARLGVLAKADEDGHRRCRPFDEKGAGFILSEAAAAVCLEREPRGDGVELERTWIGGDGSDLLAIDQTGRALRTGLGKVGCEGLDFVHAHATGTGHDAHELRALRAAAGEAVAIFSHKKWLGHSLGAAGLVGVVLSAECHRRGVTLEGKAVRKGGRSLTVSQGFGGHIGLAVLRR